MNYKIISNFEESEFIKYGNFISDVNKGDLELTTCDMNDFKNKLISNYQQNIFIGKQQGYSKKINSDFISIITIYEYVKNEKNILGGQYDDYCVIKNIIRQSYWVKNDKVEDTHHTSNQYSAQYSIKAFYHVLPNLDMIEWIGDDEQYKNQMTNMYDEILKVRKSVILKTGLEENLKNKNNLLPIKKNKI